MYEKYAMGADELRPLTKVGKAAFGDLGATLVDSLDTLWMLGLRDEFTRCAPPTSDILLAISSAPSFSAWWSCLHCA